MKKSIVLVNLITAIRVVGAFLLIPIYLSFGSFWLGIAVLLFISTDSIDGFLARTLHASTFFGAAFDALSDKLFNIIVLSIVSFVEPLMFYVLLCEIGILLVSFHSTFKGNKAKTAILGKIKMFILSVSIILVLLLNDYPKMVEMFNFSMIDYKGIINVLAIINVVIDTVTFVLYLLLDIVRTINNKDVKETIFKSKLKSKKEIKEMLFSNDFYQKNKDIPIEKLVLIGRNK